MSLKSSMMLLIFCLLSFTAIINAQKHCAEMRQSFLNSKEMETFNNQVVERIRLVQISTSTPEERQTLLWSGVRNLVNLRLFHAPSQANASAIIIIPSANKKAGVNLDVTLRVGTNMDKEVAELTQKMQQMVPLEMESKDQCLPTHTSAAMTFLKDSDFRKCVSCTIELGIVLPVVMNLLIGEGFYLWCTSKTDYGEEVCSELAVDVTLALELPIIFVGGVIILEKCILPLCADSGALLTVSI